MPEELEELKEFTKLILRKGSKNVFDEIDVHDKFLTDAMQISLQPLFCAYLMTLGERQSLPPKPVVHLKDASVRNF